jgi:YbbR domain-containing protein
VVNILSDERKTVISLSNVSEKVRFGLGVTGGIIREYAYQNLGLKLVALLIAVVLWGSVSKQESIQALVPEVRLEYINLPDGFAISNNDLLEAANVQVRGPKDLLNKLRPDMLTIRVNLANVKPGERVVPLLPGDQLSPINVLAPSNIEVIDIEPQRTRVTIERIVERQVKVVPRFADNTPQDYEVISYAVNPSTVTISGPESRVNAVPDAPTETIHLADHRTSFIERPNIDIKDLKVRILDSPTIEVQVKVEPIRVERRVAEIPLRLPQGVEKMSFSPNKVTVDVEGLKSVVEGLKPGDISAVIDLENASDSTVAGTRIKLPPAADSAVTIKSVNPPQIHIKRRR